MKKNLIYLIVGLLLVGGFFYLTLDREDKPDKIAQGGQDNSSETRGEDKSQDGDTSKVNGPRKSQIKIELGKKLPDFTLKNMEGLEKSLSDYEGKIVLLNFWASWCPPCRAEMPDMQKIHEEDEDVVVLAVNVGESKATVEKYLNKAGFTFEVLLDEKNEVAQMYHIVGFPTSYFVDKGGIYRNLHSVTMTHKEMLRYINAIREN